MSALHEAIHHPGHDHKLLDLCSGLEVLVARFDAILASHAVGDGPPIESPLESSLVDAVLGMIAIRNRLAATFTGAATEPARTRPAPVVEGSLLR